MKLHDIICLKYISISVFFIIIVQSFSIYCTAQDSGNLNSVLLLIDVSGSMTGLKIDSVKSATKQIIKMLLPCHTEFSVMGFSGKADNPIAFKMNFSTSEYDLFKFIDNLEPEGTTPLGAALKTASLSFKTNKNPDSFKQTIILLGDGQSDDNISEALTELKEKNSLVQCECIGFDIEEDKKAETQLRQIAHETGGEYYAATNVSNLIKAFFKTSIKTIIRDIPVIVRKKSDQFNFHQNIGNTYKMLISQNWIVDSIQINVSPALYEITKLIANENMQDTLPKSIVFDNSITISLFINKGTDADVNKKWIEGTYKFEKNALSIDIQNYYLKLIIKEIEKERLILCVNRFRNLDDHMAEGNEEVCDCNNKMAEANPYILIYFSKAGCNY